MFSFVFCLQPPKYARICAHNSFCCGYCWLWTPAQQCPGGNACAATTTQKQPCQNAHRRLSIGKPVCPTSKTNKARAGAHRRLQDRQAQKSPALRWAGAECPGGNREPVKKDV